MINARSGHWEKGIRTENYEVGGLVPPDGGTENGQGSREGKESGEGRHYEGPGCLLPELKACWRTSWTMPKRMEVVQGRYRAARK